MPARSTPAVLLLFLALIGACRTESAPRTSPTTEPADVAASSCLVRVHGRSETGAPAVHRDGFAELSPTGNVEDGGHMWFYDAEHYEDALERVRAAVDAAGCEEGVVLNGFSNGGAFVGHLACRGESLDGRLIGVVIDDPVPDEGVVGCRPPEGLRVALYWTGALDDEAEPGRSCADAGWICSGSDIIGIERYAEELGVPVQASPFDEHRWHRDPPELTDWLAEHGA